MPALKKTPANSPAPEQQGEQPQMRVAMLPAPGMSTIYANAFQTTFARGEILLTACVSRQEKDQQGPMLAIQPGHRHEPRKRQAPGSRPGTGRPAVRGPVRRNQPVVFIPLSQLYLGSYPCHLLGHEEPRARLGRSMICRPYSSRPSMKKTT